MPKIVALKTESHTGYPEPFRQAVLGRSRKRLGNAHLTNDSARRWPAGHGDGDEY